MIYRVNIFVELSVVLLCWSVIFGNFEIEYDRYSLQMFTVDAILALGRTYEVINTPSGKCSLKSRENK